MEVVRKGEKELLLKIPGEDATLCNLLVKTLHSVEGVEFAAFRKQHPLLSPYEIVVRTSKGKPEDALMKAAQKVIAACEELLKQLKTGK